MNLPDELMDVYIMDKMQWDYPTLNRTPKAIIDKLLLLWHIQDVASDSKTNTKG